MEKLPSAIPGSRQFESLHNCAVAGRKLVFVSASAWDGHDAAERPAARADEAHGKGTVLGKGKVKTPVRDAFQIP